MTMGGLPDRSGQRLSGLGGWLLLPLLGLSLSPIVGIWNTWQTLPTLGVLGQLPLHQSGFIVLETFINLLISAAAPIVLLVLMFQKRAVFPRLFQLWLTVNLIWLVLDIAIAYLAFRDVFETGNAELFDRETIRTLVQALVGAAIWIPYIARSNRVKNTFIN